MNPHQIGSLSVELESGIPLICITPAQGNQIMTVKAITLQSRVAASIAVLALASVTQADILGFDGLNGWHYNQAPTDTGAPATLPDDNTIHLTNLGTSQARSVFYNTRQSITQFEVSFTYQALSASTFGCEYGASFVIHNDPLGAQALGSTGSGLGASGIQNSGLISLELRSNTSGYFTNEVGGGASSVDPVLLRSGNPIEVTLSYTNGNILTRTVVDTVTAQTDTDNFIVGDLSTIVGSDFAYVGVTGSTTTGACSGNAANQLFSNFRFTEIPAPGTSVLAITAVGVLARRRRSL